MRSKAVPIVLVVLGLLCLFVPLGKPQPKVETTPTSSEPSSGSPSQPSQPKPLSVDIVDYGATPDGWVALCGSVTGGVPPVTVRIDWGDGQVDQDTVEKISFTHWYKSRGTYTVTVTAWDSTGDRKSDTIRVTAYPVLALSLVEEISRGEPLRLLGLGLLLLGAVLYVRKGVVV
jgi:hypothetical protein